MDRSRCTAILKAILDRNLQIWAPVALFGTGVLAALLGTSAILRLVSLAHQFNCKMRS